MRVLLVTSWDVKCGIAEHSALLKASVEAADSTMEIIPDAQALDPDRADFRGIDLVHLNHHDALHSQWLPGHVKALVDAGLPVLITYHDTRERIEDCPKLEALSSVASSIVVHEPVEGLPAIYWRQAVPAAARYPVTYFGQQVCAGYTYSIGDGLIPFKAFNQQPVLGSVGFNFPWKNFTRLAKVTGEMGWALLLIAHDATEADEATWRCLNPHILVVREFLPQEYVVNLLAGCDATAFMYECNNTGTSAAIRQGIAARKPLIAYGHCRQFRDLYDEIGIRWARDWDDFEIHLAGVEPVPWDAGVMDLAHRHSWAKQGADYARLYRLLGGAHHVHHHHPTTQ